VATGISLGVPNVEFAVSSGGKGECARRDGPAVDSGFLGLVEMLAPGEAPADTAPEVPFDATALIGHWLEHARGARGAGVAAQPGVERSTRGGLATDPALDMPNTSGARDDTGEHWASVMLALPALPVVPVPPVALPQGGADWTEATQASGAEARERSSLAPTDRPLEPALAGRHDDTAGAAFVSRGQSLPEMLVGARSSHTTMAASAPDEPGGTTPTTKVPNGAGDLVGPQHAEVRQFAAPTHADEALAAATAELHRALSQRPGPSPPPSAPAPPTAETLDASEPRAVKPESPAAPVLEQPGMGGLLASAAAWGGAMGGDSGQGQSDPGAEPFQRRAPWSQRGTLGPAAASAATEPFVLRDVMTLGARTPVSEARAPRDAATPDLPQQVVRAVHLQWRQGIGEARLQLKPDHLGHLTVTLRVEAGLVTAVLRTESRLAMERIEANQHELRAALEQQGLRLDRLVVAVDPDARGRRQPDAPPRSERRDNRLGKGQPVFDLNEVVSS